MGQENLVKALAGHADESNTVLPSGESERELKEISDLAVQLKRTLAPVRAPAAYKRKLENDLIELASQRARGDVQVAEPPARPEWIIGAAVALVGGIAYLLHTSRNRESHDLPAAVNPRPS